MAEVLLSGIRKTFIGAGGRPFEALRGIDLTIHSGECFSLLGPSGCGKTTLLRILAGLELPDAGGVTMDGVDVTTLPPEKRPTAMVFQNYALFPHLSVEGNVAFGLKIRKMPREEIRKKVGEALALVQLSGLERRRISELSGGQQQRVALARVLAIEPKVLLMDEPLSNLDASLRRSTRSAIRKIQSDLGLTLIYVTHDQEEALMMSDRLAMMHEGQILQSGTPRELYDAPVTAEVARFLGQRNMIPCFVSGFGEDCVKLALKENEESPVVSVTMKSTNSKLNPGDAVWLALKPSDLLIEESASAHDSGWPAEILLASFAGQSIELELLITETGETVRAIHSLMDSIEGPGTFKADRGMHARIVVRRNAGLIYTRAI